MPHFIIDTTETVHGRYTVEADNADEARAKFERGDVSKPSLFETLSVEEFTVETPEA